MAKLDKTKTKQDIDGAKLTKEVRRLSPCIDLAKCTEESS